MEHPLYEYIAAYFTETMVDKRLDNHLILVYYLNTSQYGCYLENLYQDKVYTALSLVAKARKVLEFRHTSGSHGGPNDQSSDLKISRIKGLLKSATAAISVARGDLEESALNFSASFPKQSDTVNRFTVEIIEKTKNIYRSYNKKQLSEAEGLLKPYQGLPVQFDILSLMKVNNTESVFCQLLSWLLDPNGTHGLNDAFLRLFIARLDFPEPDRIFDFSKPLEAEVMTEVSWDIPSEKPLSTWKDKGENIRRLRVDILILVHGYAIPVEIKVKSEEQLYEFEGKKWSQAALYGEMWNSMLNADKCSSKQVWKTALRKCIDTKKLRHLMYYLNGGRVSVIPVLVHSTLNCLNSKQKIGERDNEHGLPVRHIPWLDIDGMLYRLCRDCDLQAGRLDLIRSFRTTILRLDNDTVKQIQDLRLRVTEPALAHRFPLESSANLEALLTALNERADCCRLEHEITMTRRKNYND